MKLVKRVYGGNDLAVRLFVARPLALTAKAVVDGVL